MGQLPPLILPRVSALLRMLGSPLDAEALAAARALGRTLTGAGLDFHDLAGTVAPSAPEITFTARRPAPRPRTASGAPDTVLWRAPARRAVAAKLRAGLHSRAFDTWEQKFAADIAEMVETKGRSRFSPKQISRAEELAARVERQGCHA